MPAKLTSGSIATPLALVVAVPTGVTSPASFSVKETVSPGSGEPPEVSVAVMRAEPPYVPLTEDIDRLVV